MVSNKNYEEELDAKQEALQDKYREIDLPTNASERYTRLKQHIGEWQFLRFYYGFLSENQNESDIHAIASAIQQIEDIRDHERLQTKESKDKILKEAKRLVKLNALTSVDKEHLLLLIFALHNDGWFDIYPLPDAAFEFSDTERLDIFGEVYGKYFRFYGYLRGLMEKAEPRLLEQVSKKVAQNIKTKFKKEISSFKDLFHDDHKDKFDKIMQVLSTKLPVTKGFTALGNSVVSQSGEGYVWNASIKPTKSYIAGIFQVCASKYWLKTFTDQEYGIALSKTFGVKFESDTLIKKARNKALSTEYTVPFIQLFNNL